MKDLIGRCIHAINLGLSTEEIREWLLSEGLTEYDAWLTFKGASLLVKPRREA